MHERARVDVSPARPDRTGRRPLVERTQLRSVLERSTGITRQALGHLPGLVLWVLDLEYTTVEITSTIPALDDAWVASRTNQSIFVGLPTDRAEHLRAELGRVAQGDANSWRYADELRGITFETEAAPIQDPFTTNVIGIVMISRDVSDKAAAEHAAAAVLRSFRASFQRAPIPQAMLDDAGVVQSTNSAFAELIGRHDRDLVGTSFAELVLPRDASSVGHAVGSARNASNEGRQDADARLLRSTGESVHCAVHLIGFEDDALGARTIVQVIDQTERDRYEAELRMIANQDSLTGLLNRRGFRERVADSLSTGRRRNEARTLLLIDIDHFKTINDLHGHGVGDIMLCELGDLISAVIDPRDPAARIAGDEFAVLCVGGPTIARASAAALLEQIRNRAAGERRDGRPPMTISIGLAEVDRVMDDVDDVLTRADMALYEAKEWGRDCIVEASAISGDAARRSDRILKSLRRALVSDGLILHAQPILDLKSGKVTQHEMLARLIGEDGTTLSPAEFLPIAERHGLMTQLDAWVARETVRLLGTQQSKGKSLPRLHVNMSARSAEHPELVRELARDIERHHIPAGHLVVELTETTKLTNLDVARRFAAQLTDIGCTLALDDFGSGMSSLIHLKELPLEYVKIDGSIIRDAATDERAAVMIQGIASTARGLGVRSVAEYVDTQACLDRLGSLGIDFAQGFQVGEPAALTPSGRPAPLKATAVAVAH